MPRPYAPAPAASSRRGFGAAALLLALASCSVLQGIDDYGAEGPCPLDERPCGGVCKPKSVACSESADGGLAVVLGAGDASAAPPLDASVPAPPLDAGAPIPPRDGAEAPPPIDAGGCVVVPGFACGLSPQCGCGPSATCEVTGDTGRIACVNAGATPQGFACGRTADCVAGLTCELGVCRPYCATAGAACAGPALGTCVQILSQAGTPVPHFTVCSIRCELASPLSCGGRGNGCVEIVSDGKSYLDCEIVGAGAQGARCSRDYDCAPGNRCDDDGVCRKWCRLPSATYPTDCAGTRGACSSVGLTVDGVPYGTCY